MVVVATLGALTVLAAPRFTALMDRWRVRNVTETLVNTLYFAKSEAIRRGIKIGIQKLPNITGGCQLAGTNQEWGCGWIVFVDSDGNGKYKTGEEILQTFGTSTNIDVIHQSGGSAIAVDRNGKMDGLNAKGFVISPASTGISSPATRGICMAAGGRIRIIEDVPCSN
ncbi:GspH/FimT family pseudopilin [Acidovorax sp. FJL06]|uniref:GspH/FimT family pseudopilin n=1 Tax=Acidovorax sp. FJL06 TaxID=2153365 RepID=UPI000F56994B|nr:GspH/FimT family pseudopilin [Acidovorax sp. FJL06]RQO82051.1 general secretion pathway protein GspH [Acidovorax sp. FJL06]